MLYGAGNSIRHGRFATLAFVAACTTSAAPTGGADDGKADGTASSIDPERSVFIRDISVVEHADARGTGPLAFATVLRNAFPTTVKVEDLWIREFGDNLCRLPASFGVSCTSTLPYHILDMATVPADLDAIVDRVDFIYPDTPELRLVYQLPDQFFASGPDTFTRLFVNFEFDLTAVRDSSGHAISTEDWAKKFAALSSLPLGSDEYRAALEKIVTLVTRRGAAPDRPNGSALLRLQTAAEGWDYGFRQNEWDIVSHGLSDTGDLVNVGLEKVPGHAGQNAEPISGLLIDHEADVLAGTYVLPPYVYDPFNPNAPLCRANIAMMVHFGDGEIAPPSQLPAGWDAQRFETVRDSFQAQGCVGCHAVATSGGGNQIQPREAGQAVARSRFLDDVEIPRRVARLAELVSGTPSDRDVNANVVGCTHLAACSSALPATPVLNEVRTAAGMGGFVEIAGPPNLPLDGYSVTFAWHTILLDGFHIGANGYFVVASDSTVAVAEGAGFKDALFQELLDGTREVQLQNHGTVVDALAFGAPNTDTMALHGEGNRAAAPASVWQSLARSPASDDTQDNASDFTAMLPTPGQPNCRCDGY